MAINTASGFTQIDADTGTSTITMASGAPNMSIVGGTGITTSAAGNTITVTNTGSGGGGITPDFVLGNLFIYDDFVCGAPQNNIASIRYNVSTFGWRTGFMTIGVLDNEHPGTISNITGDFNSFMISDGGTISQQIILGGGELTCTWIVKLDSLSSSGSYNFQAGLMNGLPGVRNRGIWFEYTDTVNGGDWTLNCETGSVKTTANSNETVSTDWTSLKIVVNADGTSVAFFVNDVECTNSPITTNIPTSSLYLASLKNMSSGSHFHYIDLVILTQELTNPRY